jgi:uncharacterized membrane protein YjdF
VRGLVLFTLAYLLAGLLLALRGRNYEFILYIAVVLVAGLIILALRLRLGFTPGLLWALSFWGLVHMIGGLVPVPDGWPTAGDQRVFYSWWIIPGRFKYDNPVHAYGFGLATWACWQALQSATGVRRPTFGLLTLCVLAGMGLGALNEVVEFLAVLLVPETNVGGYENTAWDLVYNLLGAVTAALLIAWAHASRFGSTTAT